MPMNVLEKRRFDADPYLAELDAVVESCQPRPEGYAVVLDQTIFFPRGGGQNCDGGTVDGLEVLDCFAENDEILHILPRPLSPGQRVRLAICMENRMSHMQHHLAQHILSALLTRLYQNDTQSAHMEEGYGHIELPRTMTPDQLEALERAANDVVARDLPVHTAYYTPEEAARIPVRGRITPHASIRLVEIEGFDINACGGTHCRSTGGIGAIVLTGTKAVRGQFRIYFKAGQAALDEQARRTGLLLSAQQALGAETGDQLPLAAEETARRLREAEARLQALTERLDAADYDRLLASADRTGSQPCIARILECCEDTKHFKAIAEQLVKNEKAVVLLALTGGDRTALLLMRPKGQKTPDLGAALRTLTGRWDGKGGGSPVMAQGQIDLVSDALLDDIRQTFSDLSAQCRT